MPEDQNFKQPQPLDEFKSTGLFDQVKLIGREPSSQSQFSTAMRSFDSDRASVRSFDPLTESPISRAANAFFQTGRDLLPPGFVERVGIGFTDKSPIEMSQFIHMPRNTEGLAGTLGSATASGLFSLPLALGGPGFVQPFTLAAFAGSTAKEEFERSGSAASAISVALVEGLTEFYGGRITAKISDIGARRLGILIGRGDNGQAAKYLGNVVFGGMTNVAEEHVSEIAKAATRVLLNTQDGKEAVEELRRNSFQVTVGAAFGGAVTTSSASTIKYINRQINSNGTMLNSAQKHLQRLMRFEQETAAVQEMNRQAVEKREADIKEENDRRRAENPNSQMIGPGFYNESSVANFSPELTSIINETQKVPGQNKFVEVLDKQSPLTPEQKEQQTKNLEEVVEEDQIEIIEESARSRESLRNIVEQYNEGTMTVEEAFKQSLAIATNVTDSSIGLEARIIASRIEYEAINGSRASSKAALNQIIQDFTSNPDVVNSSTQDINLPKMTEKESKAYADQIESAPSNTLSGELMKIEILNELATGPGSDYAKQKSTRIQRELAFKMFVENDQNSLQQQLNKLTSELESNVQIILQREGFTVSKRDTEEGTSILTLENNDKTGEFDSEYVFKDSSSAAFAIEAMKRGRTVPKEWFEVGTKYGRELTESEKLQETLDSLDKEDEKNKARLKKQIKKLRKAEKKAEKEALIKGPVKYSINPEHDSDTFLKDILSDISSKADKLEDGKIDSDVLSDVQDLLSQYVEDGVKPDTDTQEDAQNIIEKINTKKQLQKAIERLGNKRFRIDSLRKDSVSRLKSTLIEFSETDGHGGIGVVNVGKMNGEESKTFAENILGVVDFSSWQQRKEEASFRKKVQDEIDKGEENAEAIDKGIKDLLVVPERILMEDLKTSQLVGLAKAFAQIDAKNKDFIKRKKKERKENSAKIVTDITSEMTQPGMPLTKRNVEETSEREPSFFAKAADVVISTANNARLETFIKYLAGSNNKTSSDILYDNPRKGQNSAEAAFSGIEKEFASQLAKLEITAEDLAALSDHKSIRTDSSLMSKATLSGMMSKDGGITSAEGFEFEFASGQKARMTKGEMLHLVGLVSDPVTFDLLLTNKDRVGINLRSSTAGGSIAVSMKDILKIREILGEKNLKIVEAIKSSMKQTSKYMGDWSQEYLFENIAMQEHHFPRQRTGVEKGQVEEDIRKGFESIESVEGNSVSKRRGRDHKSAIVVEDIFAFHHRYARTVTGMTQIGPAIREALNLLDSTEFNVMLGKDKQGSNVKARLKAQFKNVIQDVTGRREDLGTTAKLMNDLADNLTRALIGLNPQVVAYQPASIIAASTEIPWRHLMNNVNGFTQGGESQLNNDIRTQAFLGMRDAGHGRAFIDETNRTDKSNEDLAYWGIRGADRGTIRVIVAASKDWAAELNKDIPSDQPQVSWEELAEMAVRRTQPGGGTLEMTMPALMARTQPGWRLMNMFRSQRSKNADMIYSVINEARDDPDKNLGGLLAKMLSLLFAQGLWIESVRQIFDSAERTLVGEDDELELSEAFFDFNLDLLSSVLGNFYLADIPAGLTIGTGRKIAGGDAFSPTLSPAVSILEGLGTNVFKAGTAISNGEMVSPATGEAMVGFIRHFSTLSGIPANYVLGLFEDLIGTYKDTNTTVAPNRNIVK